MDRNLFIQAITKVTAGILLMALLLFWPAGTIHYPGGWLLMALLFIPMVIASFVLMAKNPDLLRKRLQMKEEQMAQKQVVALSGLMFVGGFVLSGLNFRYGWHTLPRWVVYGGAALFLLAYVLYAEVLRENTWLSRSIEVQEGQQVVDTGLYGIVRHPMYFATVLLFLSMPLVLGSIHAFLLFLVYPLLLVKRIRNEEELLERELPGYREYKQKVRWRMLPFLW